VIEVIALREKKVCGTEKREMVRLKGERGGDLKVVCDRQSDERRWP